MEKSDARWQREMQINTPREYKAMAHPLTEAGMQTAIALPARHSLTLSTPCLTWQVLWVRIRITGEIFVTHLQKNRFIGSMSHLTMTACPTQPIITSLQAT